MIVTYGLLGMAILSAWLPAMRVTATLAIPAWTLLLAAAVASGLVNGYLAPIALLSLAALLGAACWSRRPGAAWRMRLALLLAGLLALALAMHLAPGFRNPRILDKVLISPDGVPFTQYLNFDKGVVGLVLLALLCRTAASWQECGAALRKAWPAMAATVVAVLGLALATGYVRVDVKLHEATLGFLLVNLLFTCVAEEAFFRGLLQEKMAAAMQRWRGGDVTAWLAASVLFGAAHLGGGWQAAMLATLAGLGYGYVYRSTKSIEAAILTHFAVNAVHFIGFTYPYLR